MPWQVLEPGDPPVSSAPHYAALSPQKAAKAVGWYSKAPLTALPKMNRSLLMPARRHNPRVTKEEGFGGARAPETKTSCLEHANGTT